MQVVLGLVFLVAAAVVTAESDASPAPTASPIATSNIYGGDSFPAVGVQIGDSHDTVYVLVDSGAPNVMWINSTWIKTKSSTMDMNGTAFHQDYYGSNKVQGEYAKDELHLGENDLDLKGQTFAVASDTGPFSDGGNLGLSPGLQTDSSGSNFPGGWNMIAPALKKSYVVGMEMLKPSDSKNDTVAGKIHWGGVDPNYRKQGITYSPNIATDGTWSISIKGISVNGKDVQLQTQHPTMIDSGTTGILMSDSDAQAFVSALNNGEQPSKASNGLYEVPCDMKSTKIEVNIGSKQYSLDSDLLIQPDTFQNGDQSKCCSWISGGYQNSGMILGTGFLQAVYTVFDYDGKQVGFASATTSSSGSQHTATSTSAASQGGSQAQATGGAVSSKKHRHGNRRKVVF